MAEGDNCNQKQSHCSEPKTKKNALPVVSRARFLDLFFLIIVSQYLHLELSKTWTNGWSFWSPIWKSGRQLSSLWRNPSALSFWQRWKMSVLFWRRLTLSPQELHALLPGMRVTFLCSLFQSCIFCSHPCLRRPGTAINDTPRTKIKRLSDEAWGGVFLFQRSEYFVGWVAAWENGHVSPF